MKRRRAWFLAAVFGALAGCDSGSNSGDRVLVSKCQYESKVKEPQRYDVVVFKFPGEFGRGGPIENNTPKNYIKRLLGLPGEIIAIFFGRLFHFPAPGGVPPFDDHVNPEVDPRSLREKTRVNDEKSAKLFDEGRFEMLRKPPDVMMALRRIVYDNNHPAQDMSEYPRWLPAKGSGWADTKPHGFSHPGGAAEKIDWLHYRHLLRPPDAPAAGKIDPQLITDFMGYNAYRTRDQRHHVHPRNAPPTNWVGDLMIECQVDATGSQGEFWLELSKGIHRFQARFDLGSGMCTLFRNDYRTVEENGAKALKQIARTEMDSKPTRMRGPGSYQVRFANIDARLTVWVDRELPFGQGKDYPPPEVRYPEERDLDLVEITKELHQRRGPTTNDLEPASIGVQGAAVKIANLRLWRDSYYTLSPGGSDVGFGVDFSNPETWDAFRKMDYKTLYVQPRHYLCLGDNSQASSDSRQWGLVPERLMLGRALMVYYPFNRAGPIR